MNSIEMQKIYFDDIFSHLTFGRNDTDTSMLQPGRYIACLYDDDKWYIGIIMDRCNKNNHVKVKFLRCNGLCLFWYDHDNDYGQSTFGSISTYPLYCCCTTFAQQKHGTITPTGITCKKIPLMQSVTSYKQKKQKYFLLQDHQFAEDLILVFGLKERTKRRQKRTCN